MESWQLYEQGRARMAEGAFEEAAELFRRSAEIDPHFKALELLGECLARLGRLREAVVPLAAATTLHRQVRAPALLAQVFLDLGELADAREMAAVALARDPANRLATSALWLIPRTCPRRK